MGNIKISTHENSCTKQEPASSSSTSEDHGPSTLIELNKIPSLSDLDTTPSLKTLTPVASLTDLAPPNLNAFPNIKCEDDCNNNTNHHHDNDDNNDNGDHANDHMQSPDYSLWESIFSDQLEGAFMVCSPVRNTSSYGNNHAPMSSSPMHGNGVLEFSPPLFSSPRRYLHKGKGISPVQKVLNSPDNQFIRVDHVDSFAMPALESLLVDDAAAASSSSYYKDGQEDFAMFSPMKVEQGGGADGSNDWFDAQAMVPGLLECLTLPDSARFGGSTLSDQGSSQMSQESGIYQAHTLPLSQQLREERLREAKQKQQERQQIQTSRMLGQPQQQQIHRQNQLHNMHSTLMVPMLEPEQETDSGLQLVHLLLACAEAVSKQDYMLARRYIYHLNRVVSPLGDSMQRVAACFTNALSERLASTLSSKPSSSRFKRFNPFPPDNLEILKIYQIIYQACPYIKFAHFTANQAIYEAFECEERVHVIDLDILQGYQWPAFMQALAARPGGAPFLRITGVGPSPEAVIETGRCLTELAQSLHVPFEFHPVGEELEDLKPYMFNRRVGEALAVNSVNRLHRVPSNCLGNILTMIRDQAPNIVTIVEQEASHNGPYFLGRFLEALHYYSAIFDSLDATFPPESPQRSKVEQLIFAPEIRNIVAQEGPERVMRHERLERWRKVMEQKGFQCVPLSPNAVTQSTILLGLYSCDGYRLTEDKGCLLLGWQDRAILAASAWRC